MSKVKLGTISAASIIAIILIGMFVYVQAKRNNGSNSESEANKIQQSDSDANKAVENGNIEISEDVPYSDYELKTDTNGNALYSDKNYNFQLTIPAKYKYFTIEHYKESTQTTEDNIVFTFFDDSGKTQFNSSFTLNVFSLAVAEKLQQDKSKKTNVFAVNGKYAFQFNPDLGSHDGELLDTIIKTFRVSN